MLLVGISFNCLGVDPRSWTETLDLSSWFGDASRLWLFLEDKLEADEQVGGEIGVSVSIGDRGSSCCSWFCFSPFHLRMAFILKQCPWKNNFHVSTTKGLLTGWIRICNWRNSADHQDSPGKKTSVAPFTSNAKFFCPRTLHRPDNDGSC